MINDVLSRIGMTAYSYPVYFEIKAACAYSESNNSYKCVYIQWNKKLKSAISIEWRTVIMKIFGGNDFGFMKPALKNQ